jgi:hypothetical protein
LVPTHPFPTARLRAPSPAALAALAVAAAAAALGLLLALGSVLRGAVEQGDGRRRVTALHWQAVWDCNALPGPERRQACLAAQAPAPREAP